MCGALVQCPSGQSEGGSEADQLATLHFPLDDADESAHTTGTDGTHTDEQRKREEQAETNEEAKPRANKTKREEAAARRMSARTSALDPSTPNRSDMLLGARLCTVQCGVQKEGSGARQTRTLRCGNVRGEANEHKQSVFM